MTAEDLFKLLLNPLKKSLKPFWLCHHSDWYSRNVEVMIWMQSIWDFWMAKTLGKNHKNIIAPFDVDFFMCNINIFEFRERGKKKKQKLKSTTTLNCLGKSQEKSRIFLSLEIAFSPFFGWFCVTKNSVFRYQIRHHFSYNYLGTINSTS